MTSCRALRDSLTFYRYVCVFNTNAVEAIIVIIMIFLLCNNCISKHQYRPSLMYA